MYHNITMWDDKKEIKLIYFNIDLKISYTRATNEIEWKWKTNDYLLIAPQLSLMQKTITLKSDFAICKSSGGGCG